MRATRFGWIGLLAATAAFGSMAGCSDDETTPAPGTPTPQPTTTSPPPSGPTAQVRVVHASPDAPAVDVYVEGQNEPVVKGAKFGDATAFLTVPAGSYNFQLRPAGAAATTAPVYQTGALEVPAGAKITAIASGLLASSEDASKFRVLALADAFKGAADKATVRIVHGSADAPTVGIDVGNDDPAAPEVAALERFKDTGADGIQLPADTELQVGIAAGGARVTAFTTPKLPAGSELYLIATGLVGKLPREADGFSILAVGPSGAIGFVKQNPTVYALHASPDAPAVDVYAGPAEVIDNLDYAGLSAPLQLPPGEYTLDFYAATPGATPKPASAPAATAKTPALEPGQRYLAVATGFLLRGLPANDPKTFRLAAFAEGFDTSDATKAFVRLVHASPDAPAVDVSAVASGALAEPRPYVNVAFGAASDAKGAGLPPPAGSNLLPIGVAATGTAGIVATFELPNTVLTPGTRAFAVAAGAFAPQGNEKTFGLIAVETKAWPWTAAGPVAPTVAQ